MLILKHKGEALGQVQAGGWFVLPDGSTSAPAYAGWTNEDGYSIEDEPDPAPYVPTLADLHAAMKCSRMQGILALGEVTWAKVEAYRDAVDVNGQPMTPWQQKVIIDDAGDWHRNSQNIAFFGYLLGLTDDEIDAKFREAAGIVA